MSKVPGKAYCGPTTVDVSAHRDLLFDIPKGATHRLRRERPGIDEVAKELAVQISAHAADAGITPKTYQEFLDSSEAIGKLRDARTVIDKLLEVVVESEAKFVHERENAISLMADSVRAMAKRSAGPGILAPFQKLLDYNSQAAEKAAKTRRRNAKAALESEGMEQSEQTTETA